MSRLTLTLYSSVAPSITSDLPAYSFRCVGCAAGAIACRRPEMPMLALACVDHDGGTDKVCPSMQTDGIEIIANSLRAMRCHFTPAAAAV